MLNCRIMRVSDASWHDNIIIFIKNCVWARNKSKPDRLQLNDRPIDIIATRDAALRSFSDSKEYCDSVVLYYKCTYLQLLLSSTRLRSYPTFESTFNRSSTAPNSTDYTRSGRCCWCTPNSTCATGTDFIIVRRELAKGLR